MGSVARTLSLPTLRFALPGVAMLILREGRRRCLGVAIDDVVLISVTLLMSSVEAVFPEETEKPVPSLRGTRSALTLEFREGDWYLLGPAPSMALLHVPLLHSLSWFYR